MAPILLFVFKRLEHLIKTVESLQANFLAQQSELFIFSDGPNKSGGEDEVHLVRQYIENIKGFKSVTIFESEQNLGLADSIIKGVSQILETSDSAIILEDDLILMPNFLNFMNASLDKYQKESKVVSVSGFSLAIKSPSDYLADGYFFSRGWSWGWGTWKDRWEKVDWEIKDYSEFRNNFKRRLQFAKGGSDLNRMLKLTMESKLDSWAIKWFYHQAKVGGLTFYPVYSKVKNDGFDATATHTKHKLSRYVPIIDFDEKTLFTFPQEIEESVYFSSRLRYKLGFFSRIKSRVFK